MSQTTLRALPLAGAADSYRRGALLVGGAILVWSSAGLLARWVQVDPWTTLFWRSVFAALGVGAWLAVRDGRDFAASFRRLGGVGFGMALCFAASMLCFIHALSLTTVAAVLVFQAASPLFAAALAWMFLRERVSGLKLAAILVSMLGVAIIVSGGAGVGTLWGDAFSAIMGITFAGTIVLARLRADVPTTAATFVAMLIVAAISLPSAELSVPGRDMALLAAFGIGQMALALIMFTAGVRLIPAADAGLISVLESVLGPLWVWLVMHEEPGGATLIGGVIVIGAVALAARTDRPS